MSDKMMTDEELERTIEDTYAVMEDCVRSEGNGCVPRNDKYIAHITAQAECIKSLEAIVDKLPVTADGVIAHDGMKVWSNNDLYADGGDPVQMFFTALVEDMKGMSGLLTATPPARQPRKRGSHESTNTQRCS